MPESVLEALCAVGDPPGQAEWPEHAGFPFAGETTLIIDDSTLEIPLRGGDWGDGWMIREGSSRPWFWRPAPRHDAQACHTMKWERDPGYEVRLRAVIDMAWHGAPNIRTQEEYIRELLAAASAGRFANVFEVLGACYGVRLAEPSWSIAKSNYNWAHGVHITAVLTDSTGTAAVKADVLLQAPAESYPHSLLGCVDLHLNMAGLAHLLREAGAIPAKLDLRTVLRLLDVEIEDAAGVLPGLIIDDPDHVRFAAPPFVVTKIQTGQCGSDSQPRHVELADVIDLGPFGEPTKGLGYNEATIRIIGARGQDREQRREYLVDGLMVYAFAWGFAGASRASLGGVFAD
jgi:hypothetical protein